MLFETKTIPAENEIEMDALNSQLATSYFLICILQQYLR